MQGSTNLVSESGNIAYTQPFDFVGGGGEKNKVERLPFTIRLVKDDNDMRKAISIRQSAYARHIPTLAERMTEPEASDTEVGVVIFLAESKLDGRPLGTMRLHTNVYRPLPLEGSVNLPAQFDGCVLAEATRLGVTQEKVGRVVKTLLIKASYIHCLNVGIDSMLITARSPLDRHYESWLFDEVFPGRGFIPMSHIGDIPHRLFCHDIATVGARWAEARHPLYDLYFHTQHPDIDVGQDVRLPSFLQEVEDSRKEAQKRPALSS